MCIASHPTCRLVIRPTCSQPSITHLLVVGTTQAPLLARLPSRPFRYQCGGAAADYDGWCRFPAPFGDCASVYQISTYEKASPVIGLDVPALFFSRAARLYLRKL